MRSIRISNRVVRSVIGKLADLHMSRDGKLQIVTFSTESNFADAFDELSPYEVDIEIKRHYKRRSLDANAYCWVLIDKIAEKTGNAKSEVYRSAIREIGGVSDTICVQDKAVNRLRESWSKNGLGWQTDVLQSKVPGCTNVVLYYGSSVYDGKQMAQLIDSLIQDAEALGIPTISDAEAEKLVGKWAVKNEQINHAG